MFVTSLKDKSLYPIKIRIRSTGQVITCQSQEDLPKKESFVILKTKVK